MTADPDEISPTPAEDERRAAERTRSGTTSAPTGAERRPHQRQTERRKHPHERRRHARSTAPADSFGTFRRRYLSLAHCLTFRKCAKNEMTVNHKPPYFRHFSSLDSDGNGSKAGGSNIAYATDKPSLNRTLTEWGYIYVCSEPREGCRPLR